MVLLTCSCISIDSTRVTATDAIDFLLHVDGGSVDVVARAKIKL